MCNNRYLFSNFLEKLGIKFKDINLYITALTHKSYSKKNNERLEFLGDAIIELIITEKLYVDFPEKREGDLTKIRSALVKAESLSKESIKLGIDKIILLSKNEEKSGGRNKIHILANAFEALVGAIYIDQNIDITKKFIYTNLYYKLEEIIKSNLNIDPKSKLQELIQDKYKLTPIYKLISEEGPDHNKIFTVITIIGNKEYGIGRGKSKQKAEKNAAKKTLKMLKISE